MKRDNPSLRCCTQKAQLKNLASVATETVNGYGNWWRRRAFAPLTTESCCVITFPANKWFTARQSGNADWIEKMANIQALRGIRYDLSQIDSLSNVVAPPYDVINSQLQDDLYKKHPANVIRLILNREEPGDEVDAKYGRAAKFLRAWKNQGILFQEHTAAIYVYHQEFEFARKSYTRRGFMARCRLEKFGEGKIYPHEETHSAAKVDRLKLTRACKTNLSQIFGIYPDERNEAQEILEAAVAGTAPIEVRDHLGVIHRMWVVTDVSVISKVTTVLGPKPIFIADGHHRYETACNYREELRAAGPLSEDHPANFVLMMFISMSDPGMIVLPTHRLFRGIDPISSTELIQKLGNCFACDIVGKGAEQAGPLWDEIEIENEQGTFGFYCRKDDTWVRARVTDDGLSKMASLATDHSADWQSLGVALLHRLVMENLLGHAKLATPKYVHSVEEVVEGLLHGDTAGRDATGQSGSDKPFELAAMVMPATVTHVQEISLHQERMPAKSTYFYPKLLSGMVFNSLEN